MEEQKEADVEPHLRHAHTVAPMNTPEQQSQKQHPLALTPDDRRFLDRFRTSRIVVMTIIYSVTLAIAFALVWILGK